jgi:hypothetical protein
MTQQPCNFAHGLAGVLIGDAVHRDDGDTIDCTHFLVRITLARSLESFASLSPDIIMQVLARSPWHDRKALISSQAPSLACGAREQ